ncbi:MAG: aminopeptidase P family protein [Acidobacteria bacterium]|nr:aminopeptidase P family protein [Acidobacteriota bacterium]
MNYPFRQSTLRSALPCHGLDALLVIHLPNIRYLTGFTGSAAALLVLEKQSVFFSDGRYKTQAAKEVAGARVIIAQKSPLLAAAEWLNAHRPPRGAFHLGVEADHLTVTGRSRLISLLGPRTKLKAAPPLVERARMVKEPEEVRRIEKAAKLGAELFRYALDVLRPGVKESKVAAEMEYRARTRGAAGMSFPTIIAGGARSALPHGQASEARLPRRGFVVCDFGVILADYCSDQTRTVSLGRPSRELQDGYKAVLEAQQAAVQAVKPGLGVGEIDEVARNLLRKNKLDKFFTHSTGHGVGLEIHEPPRIASGEGEVLQPGMVITIEPGVYIPGKWGVRIEDLVVVTRQGCKVLTPTTRELIVI